MLRQFLLAGAIAVSLAACRAEPAPLQEEIPIVTAPPAIGKGKCPQRAALASLIYEKSQVQASKPSYGGPQVLRIADFEPFCARSPDSVICKGSPGWKMTLSEVKTVDSWLRAQFEYTDDDLMFDRSDYWADDTVCGDCEDYALTLSRYLAAKGQGGDAMWLALWVPAWAGGHATLLVDTSDAGIVEISVGAGGEPALYEKEPVRIATIRLDGKREFALEQGAYLQRGEDAIYVGKLDTTAEAIAAGLLVEKK